MRERFSTTRTTNYRRQLYSSSLVGTLCDKTSSILSFKKSLLTPGKFYSCDDAGALVLAKIRNKCIMKYFSRQVQCTYYVLLFRYVTILSSIAKEV